MSDGLPIFNQWTPVDGCSSSGDWGGGDGGCVGGGPQAMLPISEAIAVTGVNALAPLSQTPTPLASAVTLMVNGRGFFNVASPPDFSVSGNTITWLSSTYSVSPGDDVVASYFYVGPV
jgi:hypothetical protein